MVPSYSLPVAMMACAGGIEAHGHEQSNSVSEWSFETEAAARVRADEDFIVTYSPTNNFVVRGPRTAEFHRRHGAQDARLPVANPPVQGASCYVACYSHCFPLHAYRNETNEEPPWDTVRRSLTSVSPSIPGCVALGRERQAPSPASSSTRSDRPCPPPADGERSKFCDSMK